MATSRHDQGRATPSPPSHQTTHRPAHLQDYVVEYGDRGKQRATPSPRPEVSRSSSLSSLLQNPGPSSTSATLMQQIVEMAKQQSETAKQQSETAQRQTELLHQVLLRTTPQNSEHSSKAASRQHSPWAHPLRTVERAQTPPDGNPPLQTPNHTKVAALSHLTQSTHELSGLKLNPQPSMQPYPSPPLLSCIMSLSMDPFDQQLNTMPDAHQSAYFMPLHPLPLMPEERPQLYNLPQSDFQGPPKPRRKKCLPHTLSAQLKKSLHLLNKKYLLTPMSTLQLHSPSADRIPHGMFHITLTPILKGQHSQISPEKTDLSM